MVTRRFVLALVGMAGMGAMAAPSFAVVNPLNLVSQAPDVTSNQITETYTVSGSTASLTADGTATHLKALPTDPDSGTNITGGTFHLDATFTLAGTGASAVLTGVSGHLTVHGNSQDYFASTNLVSVTGTAGNTLELEFSGSTGTYTGLVGILLHNDGTTFTNFGTSFTNNSVVIKPNSDTFSVPEPASLSLAAIGIPMMLLRRRKA